MLIGAGGAGGSGGGAAGGAAGGVVDAGGAGGAPGAPGAPGTAGAVMSFPFLCFCRLGGVQASWQKKSVVASCLALTTTLQRG